MTRPYAALLLALPALLAAGPAVPDPAAALAGRFYKQFPNGTVDGGSYTGEDIVEIVPVSRGAAYLRFSLSFFNGHSCSLAGIAEARGDALVYRGPADDVFGGGKPCRLAVRRAGARLTWTDGGTCKAHCGARGSFLGGALPWASRRRITYLARLKASDEYRRAMSEWRR